MEPIHQVFVVQQLALFERPKSVQLMLKENFGLEVSLQAICYYDVSNEDLPKKLKTLFNSTRKNFLKNADSIPIANKSYRLIKLQKMFESEENQSPLLQNKVVMRALLEQAAKESGDSFTNKQKHEVTGKDGDPVKFETRVILPNVDDPINQ